MAISKESKETLKIKINDLNDKIRTKQIELKALEDFLIGYDVKKNRLKNEIEQLKNEKVSIQADARD